jgi:HAE1 family hydrophobic/amphiphilic exporter-1
MVFSTTLNLVFIPVLYVLLKSFLALFSKSKPSHELPPPTAAV